MTQQIPSTLDSADNGISAVLDSAGRNSEQINEVQKLWDLKYLHRIMKGAGGNTFCSTVVYRTVYSTEVV